MRDPHPFTVFVARLAEAKRPEYNGPRDLARDAEDLRLAARRLDAIHTRQCNGYQKYDPRSGHNVADPDREAKDERAEAKARAQVEAIAARYGFDVHHQTDPRGLPVYLGYAPRSSADGMTERNYSTHGIAVPL